MILRKGVYLSFRVEEGSDLLREFVVMVIGVLLYMGADLACLSVHHKRNSILQAGKETVRACSHSRKTKMWQRERPWDVVTISLLCWLCRGMETRSHRGKLKAKYPLIFATFFVIVGIIKWRCRFRSIPQWTGLYSILANSIVRCQVPECSLWMNYRIRFRFYFA